MWKQDTCALRPFGNGAGHIETGARVVNMQKFMVLGAVLRAWFFFIGIGTGQKHEKVAEEKGWTSLWTPTQRKCWAVSQPQETLNTLNGKVVPAQRGEILLFVF